MPVRIFAMILATVLVAAGITVFLATQVAELAPLPAIVGFGSVPLLLILYLIARKR